MQVCELLKIKEAEKLRQEIFGNNKQMLGLDIQLERSLGSDDDLEKAARTYNQLLKRNGTLKTTLNQKLLALHTNHPVCYRQYVDFHIYVLTAMALHEKQKEKDSTRLFVINETIQQWQNIAQNDDLFVICNTYYTADHSQWVNSLLLDFFEGHAKDSGR